MAVHPTRPIPCRTTNDPLQSFLLAVALFLGLGPWTSERVRAQDGGVDPVFGGASQGLLGKVYQAIPLPDGKVMLEGGPNGVLRLASNGDVDTGFRIANGGLRAVQPDGKVLISGDVVSTDGTTHIGLYRVNPDGVPDPTFAPVVSEIRAVNILADGKMIVGGVFTALGGVPSSYVARLNPDGSVDASFIANLGDSSDDPPGYVDNIAVLPDGKLIVSGFFAGMIVRLNIDGTLDDGFQAPDFNVFADDLAVQADGKILVSGRFEQVGGAAHHGIVRLNTDGTLDASFNAKITDKDSFPEFGNYITLQADGKIFLYGFFNQVNGIDCANIVRLNGDGGFDPSFNLRASGEVTTIALQADGGMLVGGTFRQINGVACNSIVRLTANGVVDRSFSADVTSGANGDVSEIVRQSDGRVVLCGNFTGVNGVDRYNIARLNADASLDTGFHVTVTGSLDFILHIAKTADDKIVLCGYFTGVNGIAHNNIARLNADGTLDSSFNTDISAPGTLAVQPDGKILLDGPGMVNGVRTNTMIRLNVDGSLDTTFRPGNYSGSPIIVRADGKILLGGLTRLNSDGSLDSSYNVTADNTVTAVTMQADGRVLLGGDFTQVDGVTAAHIARVNADGGIDTTFHAGVDFDSDGSSVDTILAQANGKIVVGGSFNRVNGQARHNLAHLDADGSLDPFINVTNETNGRVEVLTPKPDGKILMGGAFTIVRGGLRNHLAGLKASDAPGFFADQVSVSGGFYYMKFAGGNPFGYYNLAGPGYSFPYFFHSDLGMEYFFDANDGAGGAYLYDFASSTFFYTSPAFPFPYLYDFRLNTVVYYYPDPTQPDRYNTNGVRYFYRFDTRQIIVK